MKLLDRLKALRALLREPMRSVLTLLGIIIGSGSIVLVAGLVSGAEIALVAANQSVSASDLVEVRAKDLPERERLRGRPALSRADAQALGSSWFGKDRQVHSENWHEARASYLAKKKYVRFVSADEDTQALFRLELLQGRFIQAKDGAEGARVCVIGHEIWAELLGSAPLTPDTKIHADNTLWSVVGILKPKPMIGSTTGTNIWSRKILVPERTFDAVYAADHHVGRILLRGADAEASALAADTLRGALTHTLLRRHQQAHNFKLDDAKERALEQTILKVIKLLLLASGLLTLSTGAINVANVMFVSVSERTREIGLRRALGETRRSILGQFLLEAATLGLVGGMVGALGGVLAVNLGGYALKQVFSAFAVRVPLWSLGSGLGLSLLAGVLAGLLPAIRAANQDPVAALRSE